MLLSVEIPFLDTPICWRLLCKFSTIPTAPTTTCVTVTRHNRATSLLLLLFYFFVVFFCAAGHVGPPIPCNIVKLVDVEEMEYFAKSGQGEVRHMQSVEVIIALIISFKFKNWRNDWTYRWESGGFNSSANDYPDTLCWAIRPTWSRSLCGSIVSP